MIRTSLSLACLALCVVAAPANATMVTSIKITNAIPDWLQVSEVIATQAGTGNDVALATAGASAFATSSGYGTTPDAAIDGAGPAAYPNIYHSGGSSGSDYLLITLAQAYDLASLTIDGRADSYGSRDYYGYQLFDGMALVGSGNIDARNDAHSGTAPLGASAVPEPAAWAMMVAGFGLVGAGLRRRTRIAPTFA
jgi:hypothetical protein